MAESIVNFDNGKEKSAFINSLRRLKGKQRIKVVKHRPRRSDRQNRYYWPCFVTAFGEFMRGQGEHVTDLQCHEMFKNLFLRKTATNWATGESFDYTQSTSDLDTLGFNQYLDAVAVWLSASTGIVVPEPSEYHEKETNGS